ncbi:hypothetical protein OKW41_001159 [Paraburkholderia sp. UCT70]
MTGRQSRRSSTRRTAIQYGYAGSLPICVHQRLRACGKASPPDILDYHPTTASKPTSAVCRPFINGSCWPAVRIRASRRKAAVEDSDVGSVKRSSNRSYRPTTDAGPYFVTDVRASASPRRRTFVRRSRLSRWLQWSRTPSHTTDRGKCGSGRVTPLGLVLLKGGCKELHEVVTRLLTRLGIGLDMNYPAFSPIRTRVVEFTTTVKHIEFVRRAREGSQ